MSKSISGSKDSEEKDDQDTDDLPFPDNRSADYLPPIPPDGGWGWIVCLASFVCNLIVDGVCYTFAIFAGEIQNHFESTKSKTALVGSMVPGFYLIVGPIVGALANKFGCRIVTICGSIVAAAFFIISTTSSSIEVMTLTYGVMGGVGFGMMYLPSIVMVGFYFDKKRALATGIAVCGSGIGTFVFAPLGSALVDSYGWKGANLILAGIILNGVACGAVYRTLEAQKADKCVELEKSKIMLSIAAEKHRQRLISTGSMDGILITKDNKLIKEQMAMVESIPEENHEDVANSEADEEKSSETETNNVTSGITENSAMLDKKDTTKMAMVETIPEENREEVANSDASEEKSSVFESNNVTSGITENSAMLEKKDTTKMAMVETIPEENREEVANSDASEEKSSVFESNNVTSGITENSAMLDKKETTSAIGSSSLSVRNKRAQQQQQQQSLQPSDSAVKFSSNGKVSVSELGGSARLRVPMSEEERKRKKSMESPFVRHDILYTGSVTSIHEYKASGGNMEVYVSSILSIPTGSIGQADQFESTGVRKPNCWDRVTSVILGLFDFSLLMSPTFLVITASGVMAFMGLYTPFVYVTQRAIDELGIEPTNASYILSIIGVFNTLARVFTGWLSDQPWADALLIHNVSVILAGVATCLVPVLNSYALLCIYGACFGVFIASFIALRSVVMAELLGIDKLTNCFGLCCLFQGLAVLIGSPMSGAMQEATNSYTLPFLVSGSMFILGGLVCLPARRISNWERKRNDDRLNGEDQKLKNI